MGREGIRFSVSVLAEDRVDPKSKIPDARPLEEVLQSKCFERASRLRALLLYLWENRNLEISEYAIAVDGLGKAPDFESKIDATVRVQIARLRDLLRKYYEGEGSRSTIRIVIPLGTHQVQLVEAIPESEVAGGCNPILRSIWQATRVEMQFPLWVFSPSPDWKKVPIAS